MVKSLKFKCDTQCETGYIRLIVTDFPCNGYYQSKETGWILQDRSPNKMTIDYKKKLVNFNSTQKNEYAFRQCPERLLILTEVLMVLQGYTEYIQKSSIQIKIMEILKDTVHLQMSWKNPSQEGYLSKETHWKFIASNQNILQMEDKTICIYNQTDFYCMFSSLRGILQTVIEYNKRSKLWQH